MPTLCTTPKMQPVGLKLFKATHSTVWAFTEPWRVPRTVLGATLHDHQGKAFFTTKVITLGMELMGSGAVFNSQIRLGDGAYLGIYVSVLDVRWENCFLYIPEASIPEGEGISRMEEVMGLSGNVQPIAGPNLRLCGELDCVNQDHCTSAKFLATSDGFGLRSRDRHRAKWAELGKGEMDSECKSRVLWWAGELTRGKCNALLTNTYAGCKNN